MTATTEDLIDQLVEAIEYHEDREGELDVRGQSGWVPLSTLVEDLSDALEVSDELALNQANLIQQQVEHHVSLEGELDIRGRRGWDDARDPIAEIVASLESR